MKVMCAKDFAKLTGWPIRLVRRYCREGRLPHIKNGQVYLIDMSMGLAALKNIMAAPETKIVKGQVVPVLHRRTSASFLDLLKNA